MNVSQAMQARRSVRAFLPQAPSPDEVQRLIADAAQAASGGNLQPWRVVAQMRAKARRPRRQPENFSQRSTTQAPADQVGSVLHDLEKPDHHRSGSGGQGSGSGSGSGAGAGSGSGSGSDSGSGAAAGSGCGSGCWAATGWAWAAARSRYRSYPSRCNSSGRSRSRRRTSPPCLWRN